MLDPRDEGEGDQDSPPRPTVNLKAALEGEFMVRRAERAAAIEVEAATEASTTVRHIFQGPSNTGESGGAPTDPTHVTTPSPSVAPTGLEPDPPRLPALSKRIEYPGDYDAIAALLDGGEVDPAGRDMFGWVRFALPL